MPLQTFSTQGSSSSFDLLKSFHTYLVCPYGHGVLHMERSPHQSSHQCYYNQPTH